MPPNFKHHLQQFTTCKTTAGGVTLKYAIKKRKEKKKKKENNFLVFNGYII